LYRIEAKILRWLGHMMRMPEERWPAIIHSWFPLGRRMGGMHHRGNEKKGGGKKMLRTWYFAEEDWEGGGQPYRHIYTARR
jgi:hypothetical protein